MKIKYVLPVELNDFQTNILRNYRPAEFGAQWEIIVMIRCRGELVDCERKTFSNLETLTGLNMEIQLMIDRLRTEFERIL